MAVMTDILLITQSWRRKQLLKHVFHRSNRRKYYPVFEEGEHSESKDEAIIIRTYIKCTQIELA